MKKQTLENKQQTLVKHTTNFIHKPFKTFILQHEKILHSFLIVRAHGGNNVGTAHRVGGRTGD